MLDLPIYGDCPPEIGEGEKKLDGTRLKRFLSAFASSCLFSSFSVKWGK
jgi:hypothetical protein